MLLLINSLFKNSKIYEVRFDEMVYLGSTCEDLETRLKWHKNNKKKPCFQIHARIINQI